MVWRDFHRPVLALRCDHFMPIPHPPPEPLDDPPVVAVKATGARLSPAVRALVPISGAFMVGIVASTVTDWTHDRYLGLLTGLATGAGLVVILIAYLVWRVFRLPQPSTGTATSIGERRRRLYALQRLGLDPVDDDPP